MAAHTSNILDVQEIENLENLIRTGESRLAKKQALVFVKSSSKLSQEHIIHLANILRRTGAYELAVQVLHPLIRSPSANQVSDRGKAEYGAALIQMGFVDEALEVMKNINSQMMPETFLYQSFALMSDWRYPEAIPILRKYVASQKDQSYSKYVGLANLYDSLVFVEPNTCDVYELKTFVQTLERADYGLLAGAANQILGRLFIEKEDYSNAIQAFDVGLARLTKVETTDRLHLEKWKLIAQTLKNGRSNRVKIKFEDIRTRARAIDDFETWRDCDFHEGRLFSDEQKLTRVYYGTPSPHFRSRFVDFSPSPKYFIRIHNDESAEILLKHKSRTPIFQLERLGPNIRLKPQSQLEILFHALLSDLYRPMTLARLFPILQPKQYWNPQSGPNQMRQLTHRLRAWLRKSKSGLFLKEHHGRYELRATKKKRTLALSIRPTRESLSATRLREFLKGRASDAPFSFEEFQEFAGCSLRTARRLIKSLLLAGEIGKSGNTRACLYHQIVKPRR